VSNGLPLWGKPGAGFTGLGLRGTCHKRDSSVVCVKFSKKMSGHGAGHAA